MMPLILFINDKPSNINDILVNKDCLIKPFKETNLYEIYINNQPVNWLIKTYKDEKYAKREANILTQLEDVKGVPRLFALGTSTLFSYIILSKFEGKEMFEYRCTFKEAVLKDVARQLLKILSVIHSKNLSHQDIKPENLIYNSQTKQLHLIDFEQKITDGFVPPEFFETDYLKKKFISKEQKYFYEQMWDVWSFGITLFDIKYGRIPFKNKNEICTKNISFSEKESPLFVDFIQRSLEKDKNNRATAEFLLNHEWL